MEEIMYRIVILGAVLIILSTLARAQSTYNPSQGMPATTKSNSVQVTVNGMPVLMAATTNYLTTMTIVTVYDLYHLTTFPQSCILMNVKVVKMEIYTNNAKKSFVDVSDSSTSTLRCWYWYKDIPYKPVLQSVISVWGKPYAGPKIDMQGMSIAKTIQ
jgi:hypothetical protein